MVDERHKEVQKASTSKGAESPINDATRDESENESSSDSEGLNYGEVIRKELEELKKGGMMNDSRNEMATYRDFMACEVPKIDGMLDPIACTKWLSTVEGAFCTSCCKEKNKVNFALNFLRDSAKMWWEGKIYEKGEEWIGTCTWKEFKEMFTTEYAPVKEVDKIQEEFQTLAQTYATVNEMWKKFNDLIRYCPKYHWNEKLKVEKFQRMLRDDIREVISPFKCTTLEDLLSRARLREAYLLRKKNKETKRKLDFIDRDAKKPKQDQGRRSTILVNSIPARVLYDSGVSVSFVSFEFSKNLSTPPNKLHFPLEVEIASNEIMVVSKVYRDVEIEIDDSVFRIDLIPIVLGAFDIVIGMDWLDRYNANTLCSQKLVRAVNPQGQEIIIYGDKKKGEFKLCSIMKTRKYLPHGCQAFMAHVIDTRCEKKSVKDVSVVNEFIDVFPKDLLGIPPERQVEFQIDLIPGETPIAKTP
uniref:Zinc finger, CCHC-type, retrotransposon Gag domain protein n=1 Tax=Tanacetum cinerariifolium TaxID=118510 RepID=A0A6L2L6K9_TANCI|nr:zinc finger, CCHC-type, retrotransposon Gag domain protein [Tanacetum cinerariifolium]